MVPESNLNSIWIFKICALTKLEAKLDLDLLQYHTSYMITAIIGPYTKHELQKPKFKDKVRILFKAKHYPLFDLLFDLK